MRSALLADLEPDLQLVERVAVFTAAGYRRGEIADRVEATPAQLRQAFTRLKRVAPDLDLEVTV